MKFYCAECYKKEVCSFVCEQDMEMSYEKFVCCCCGKEENIVVNIRRDINSRNLK